eukprot:sb/3467885/
MATVDVERIKSDVMTLDGSPLNHASAILSELENSHSEEVSVDVRITEESERVVEKTSGVEEVDSSEQTNTSATESEEEDSDFEIIKEDEVKMSNGDTVTTTKTTRRRSERIQKHTECAAALFSDDDELPIIDVDGETDSQPESESSIKERWSLLLKIFLLSILFAIIANAIAYIHLSNPEFLQGVLNKVNSYLPNTPVEESPSPPVEGIQRVQQDNKRECDSDCIRIELLMQMDMIKNICNSDAPSGIFAIHTVFKINYVCFLYARNDAVHMVNMMEHYS